MGIGDTADKIIGLVPIAMAVGIAEKALEIPGKVADRSSGGQRKKKKTVKQTASKNQKSRKPARKTKKKTGGDDYDIMTFGLPGT